MEYEKDKISKFGVKAQKDLPIHLQQPTNFGYQYQYSYQHKKP